MSRPNAQDAPAARTWLQYPDAAVYLGISTRALKRLVSDRKISHTKLGKSVLFSAEQLDAYVEACTVEPGR